MRRNAEKDLKNWFRKKERTPLVLRGARQVGKSTLVRLFCKENGITLIEVNLEIVKLRSIYKEPFDIQNILDEIQLLTGKRIFENSLLFFDEIQEEPKLLNLLRYFYEQRPDLAVVAAGSLLEIAIREGEYSFPVGRVEFYNLGPMTFFEFLSACGQDLLRESLENLKFSETVYTLAKTYFEKYLYIGGMPKAVLTYVETQSLVPVRELQSQILQTYAADFPKYSKRIDVQRVARIFESCSLMIGKKVVFQKFDSQSKSRDIRTAIELLIDARLLLPCYHSEASGIPLEALKDENTFKLFLLDVGLLNCMLRLDFEMLRYEAENNFISKGAIAEQFAAQHLAYFDGPSKPLNLNYWLREKGSQKGEIDFLIQDKNKVVPVEIKAVTGGRLKSLFYFAKEKRWTDAIQLSLYPYSVQKIKHKIAQAEIQVDLTRLPLYAVESVSKVI